MKTLVIYYSRSGNTRFVAEKITQELSADLKEIIDKKNRQGFWGYFWAGHDTIVKAKTEIEEINLNPENYDIIFLGCPTWVASVPPAIRTFLDKTNLEKKRLVLFCTQDSMGAEKTLNIMRLLARGAEIIDQKFFSAVEKNKVSVEAQIKEWIGKLLAEPRN
ncbi:MAG: flavodoxin [Patescibacteria group bacterium]|nr:flavodoxin [Patescibacteria group bacterium]